MANLPATDPKRYKVLNQEQIDNFMKHGFLRIEGAFTQQQSDEWTKDIWNRLGWDPEDKTTWARERTNMPKHRTVKVSDYAPKAWEAICELSGGEDRVTKESNYWNDGFIINLGTPEHEGQEANPKELGNWHVDGDFFVHFLDSPEQGLLVIPLFTDIVPNGGGTWVASDGIPKIAKWLNEHPQGCMPRMIPRGEQPQPGQEGLSFYNNLIQQCSDFHEMTGKVGDVILLHPLIMHSASKNGLRKVRIITNPPVSLNEPFQFDRPNENDFSLVEIKTLHSLGVDRLPGFKIQGERESVIPERLKVQAKLMEEERERLKKMGAGYGQESNEEWLEKERKFLEAKTKGTDNQGQVKVGA